MKKILLTFLSIVMISAVLTASFVAPASAEAYSGSCGANGDPLIWTLDTETKTLTVSGAGSMQDYTEESPAPWFDYRADIQTVIVSVGVTSIGDMAFFDCTALLTVYNCSALTLTQGSEEHGGIAYYAETVNAHLPGAEATCTTNQTCVLCAAEIKPAGHTEVVLAAVKATFFSDGLTSGSKCSACGEILTEQTVVGSDFSRYFDTEKLAQFFDGEKISQALDAENISQKFASMNAYTAFGLGAGAVLVLVIIIAIIKSR